VIGIFLLMKLMTPAMLNYVVGIYVVLTGSYAVSETVQLCISTFNPSFGKQTIVDIKFNVPWPFSFWLDLTDEINFYVTRLSALSILTAVALSAGWFISRFWFLNNALGVSFSIIFIKYVSVGSFSVAFLLLAGLFVYDIFWVFATSVMVDVAKNFDIPAKLLLVTSRSPWKTGLLGLGDIVLPGLMISMALRFDWERNAKSSKFKPTFFLWSLSLYAIGLCITSAVMNYFQKAQPALLYLVPAGYIGVLVPAIYTGSVRQMWSYSEEEEKTNEEDDLSSESESESECEDVDNTETNMEAKNYVIKNESEIRQRLIS